MAFCSISPTKSLIHFSLEIIIFGGDISEGYWMSVHFC